MPSVNAGLQWDFLVILFQIEIASMAKIQIFAAIKVCFGQQTGMDLINSPVFNSKSINKNVLFDWTRPFFKNKI